MTYPKGYIPPQGPPNGTQGKKSASNGGVVAAVIIFIIILILVIVGLYYGYWVPKLNRVQQFLDAGCEATTAGQYGIPTTYKCPVGANVPK